MRSLVMIATATGLTLSGGLAAAPQVDEIVVYAQKKGRAENLQEVPAAVSAYNAEQLDGIVFEKLDDLSYSIPNVQLEQVGTFPGVQNFSIRGQGINSSIPSVDPTVGVFIDGIYQGTTYGTVLDTWDLESVEILRGPQGLLFGRNVTGGAVTVRTARPDPDGETAYKMKALITDEERYNVAVAFESPIGETLAGKIMLYYDDDDGYFANNNLTSGAITSPPFVSFDPVRPPSGSSQRNAGKFETKIARPTLVFTPSDELEVALIGEYGKAEGDGAAWTVVTGGLPAPLVPVPIGSTSGGGQQEFSTTSNDYGFAEVEWKSATLEINWDVFGGTLTSLTGWKDVQQDSATDVDGTYLPAFVATGATDQDQISEELRFFTTIGDNWDMTLGAYYLNIDQQYREGRYIQINPFTLALAPDLLRIGLGGDMETTTLGLFINNEISVTEYLTVIAGLRYSDEEKDARIIDGPMPPIPVAFCPDVTTFMCSFSDLKGDWSYWTPKLGLQWDFAEDAQAYAFWTKGYRAGGFNFRNAKPGPIPPLGYPAGPTREEEQNSFEVGLKSEVFDNRLRMNLAYFYNKIDDMQRELNQGDPDVIVLQATINAGDVTIKGVEFEFESVPTDEFSIWGSIGYLDGSYDNINPLYTGINPATGAPYIGTKLPRLARWSFSLGSSYDFNLDGNGVLRVQADFGYRDPNFYDDANTQRFDAQHRLGASINWISPDDQWTVSMFGKNLHDEANYGNLTSIAGLYTAGPMQKGREYGLQVQFRSR